MATSAIAPSRCGSKTEQALDWTVCETHHQPRLELSAGGKSLHPQTKLAMRAIPVPWLHRYAADRQEAEAAERESQRDSVAEAR